MHARPRPTILILLTLAATIVAPAQENARDRAAVAGRLALVAPAIDSVVEAGTEFVIEIAATNSGAKPWPDSCQVTQTIAGQADRIIPLVARPEPGRTVSFFVQGLAGDKPGRFSATFSLLDGTKPLSTAEVAVTVRPASPPPQQPPIMAEIVSFTMPSTLVTDEVFTATLVVRNTGSVEWGNSPEFHLTWRGFPFSIPGIYFGQGATVAPGAQVSVGGSMRAPSAPGEYTSTWVMVRGDGWGIGRAQDVEISARTPPTKITVTQGPFTPLLREERPGKLSDADFTYIGAFAVPRGLEGLSTSYTGSGISLRTRADQTKTLFANAGPNGGPRLYEMAIPEPSTVAVADQLPEAKVVAFYGDIYGARGELSPSVSGLHFDEASRTLYWSCWHGYYSGTAGNILGATRIGDDGTATPAGIFTTSEGCFKGFWGGITPIDPAFADKHLGGRRLGLGFGGYFSICQTTSEGPAFAAIATPDAATPTLDLTPLISYPFAMEGRKACARPGNYFLNAIWGEQPKDAGTGSFSAADGIGAGVWITFGGKEGLVFFPTLAEGWICYHYAAIHAAGYGHYRYIYDPADIATAAHGAKPWDIQPYSISSFTAPHGGKVGGVTFDQQTGRLYVLFDQAYKAGVELYAVVCVYQIGATP